MNKKEYGELVKKKSPKSLLPLNCLRAFWVGGLICTIGQVLMNAFTYNCGMDKLTAGAWTSICLVFAGAFLTGIGIYDKIGKYAGAGSVVPITGFSNSVVASAIEFKSEGFVMGLGAKMFIIAGPVIVYGVCTSSLVGLVYFIVTRWL